MLKNVRAKDFFFFLLQFSWFSSLDILTSTFSNGIKRSNVCGEGYRIDGAVLRSYPYSINETYSPYENCLMTFQSRRSMNSMLIRILILDLNDISAGKKCLDTLHFYDSVHINNRHRLVIKWQKKKKTNKYSYFFYRIQLNVVNWRKLIISQLYHRLVLLQHISVQTVEMYRDLALELFSHPFVIVKRKVYIKQNKTT